MEDDYRGYRACQLAGLDWMGGNGIPAAQFLPMRITGN
jgi:hypothetical protein